MVLSKSNIHRPSDCWSRNLCIVAVVDNYFPVPMLCSLLGPVTLQHSSLAVWRADTSSTAPPHSARCGDKSYVWNIVHRIKNSGLRAVIYIVFILKGGYTPNIKYTSFAVPLGGWGEHELANVFVLDLFWPCKVTECLLRRPSSTAPPAAVSMFSTPSPWRQTCQVQVAGAGMHNK